MSDQLNIPFPVITMPNGKYYHESAEPFQRDFHASESKFRWLGGRVGGGKSAASTVEVLWHSWMYPDNYGFILRKTFPELKLSAIKDFDTLTPHWMIVERNKQEHWVDVYNHIGFAYRNEYYAAMKSGKMKKRDYLDGLREIKGTSRVEFISFEGTEAAEQKFRSANIGWYMMEQAEEGSLIIYDRLNERMRKEPAARQAWFISNPDGRDWLWDIFSPESEGKRRNHEMFSVDLSANKKNLPADFEESLEETYSEEDYDRLVRGSFDVATSAVFPEFSFDLHVVDHFEPPETWEKCFSLDHGLNNETGAIHIAKLPTGELYFYNEYHEKGKLVREHATVLKPQLTKRHRILVIDPTCVNREPISGATVIGEYARYGIPFMPGVKDLIVGINRMKEYMQYDPEHENPFTKKKGSPRFFVSDRCIMLIRQLMRYKWDTVKTNRGASNQPEKPRKYFDHLVDASRWGTVAFTPPRSAKSHVPATNKLQLLPAKEQKFGFTVDAHDNLNIDVSPLVADAAKVQRNSRATSWS